MAQERIELQRVVFRDEGIDVPGMAPEQYPARQKILFNDPASTNRLACHRNFNLYLEGMFVVIEHPVSFLEERVPLSNVAQFRMKKARSSK